MSNPFKIIGSLFVKLFQGIFSSSEAEKLEQSVQDFIGTDIGRLAVDAVEYVAATATPGQSGVEKRDAAKAKLKADAKAAGKDLEALGESTLNWFVETALQALVAKFAGV